MRLNVEIQKALPFTKLEEMKKPKWSFLYAYNLRTVRDIFVYCALKEKIREEDLYKDMKEMKIPPPKDRWFSPRRKRTERLRLEYVHAAKYLGLIKKEGIEKAGNFLLPDFSNFEKEKRIVVEENQKRSFEPSRISPAFTRKEKEAMRKIALNYERARDFLWWFLDFSQFTNIWSFDENDFRKHAKPVFLFGPIKKGKKGREILKREIDGKIWKIPDEKPYDYTRLASFVFPAWFKELGLIDKVIVFPEFSEDRKLWYMYYPIKMSEEEFLKLDMFEILESLFVKEGMKNVWTPYLIYVIAREYNCPTKAIKMSVENVYKAYPGHFYLERVPLHLMKRHHKESYIKIGGFFRSYLNLIKMRKHEQ